MRIFRAKQAMTMPRLIAATYNKFHALNTLGLLEIYECFQGDIDNSMQRDDNF